MYLLLNLRSPRDYVGSSVRSFVRSRLWYFLSLLDGASVREAHCEQASTAVREAHCAQATEAHLVTLREKIFLTVANLCSQANVFLVLII